MERCNPETLERAVDTRGAALWMLTTQHPLGAVVRAGYFDTVLEHGLRRHDRIWVAASANARQAQYATLIIEAAGPDGIVTRVVKHKK